MRCALAIGKVQAQEVFSWPIPLRKLGKLIHVSPNLLPRFVTALSDLFGRGAVPCPATSLQSCPACQLAGEMPS